jgi:thioredoxin-like negative regulator of GroEL
MALLIRDVNDERLDEIVKSSASTVIGIAFLGSESEPCKKFVPELVAAAQRLEHSMTFYRIDALENPDITDKHGVKAVPTLLIFKNGKEIGKYEGPYSREALYARITKIL